MKQSGNKIVVGLVLFFCLTKISSAQENLLPKPQELIAGKGSIEFSSLAILAHADFEKEVDLFIQFMEEKGIEKCQDGATQIKIKKGSVKNPHGFEGAYRLIISDGVELQAASACGIFYGLQTLKQLIGEAGKSFSIPQCEINDWPAFKIRGFMHDVGRNYISVNRLKQQLEIMAAYKYNVFHMHLTDNPGWRLESKIYPQLQSAEATSRKPGKYYTQKEFRDLVAFCKKRHITMIPELDMPGHTLAFRKAFGLEAMNSPKVQGILLELIEELFTLASAEDMPYIHLGTDEVRRGVESVDRDFMLPLIRAIEHNDRTYISWWHGLKTPGDTLSVKQLWASTEPIEGHSYIDSRSNYINHLDPLCAPARLWFQQPCRAPYGDEVRLGGILCSWPDNRVDDENNIFRQNPIFPALLAYSEAVWRGVKESTGKEYWAQLPRKESKEYSDYMDFENRILYHRNLYFEGLEFPFVKNAHIPWKIIGPFDHGKEMSKSFPVENEMKEAYTLNGKSYRWKESEVYGGTIHIKHFFGFPSPIEEKKGTVYALNYIHSDKEQEVGFWIGFHGWSRAGGRRGGPTPGPGQWHTTDPKIWVNEMEIAPPVWKQPGLAAETPEIPLVDEDYFYRTPTKIKLKKGWNKFLLKIPHGGTSWKWMFTCVPVHVDGNKVREVSGLEYATEIEKNEPKK